MNGRRYGLLLGLLSLAFLVQALVVGPRGAGLFAFVALVWATVATQLVAAAYLVGEPGVFGKRADGRLSAARSVVLLPYLLVAWAIRDLAPLATREPAYNQVADGLWVGRHVRRFAALPRGVGCVVDLTAESPVIGGLPDTVEYICIPTLDGTAPPLPELEALVARLAEVSNGVYVHCAAGHARSALVAAALLLARGEAESPGEAVALLSRHRPRVSLNSEQQSALSALSDRLGRVSADDDVAGGAQRA